MGIVRDASGTAIGMLTLTWAAASLRRARMAIAQEGDAEIPLDNGLAVDWAFVFRGVGWDFSVIPIRASVTAPDSGVWSESALHDIMIANRPFSEHDSEWIYHMLCVREFDPAAFDPDTLGIMYDRGPDDLNQIPREGFAVSANRTIGTDAVFGSVAGKRIGEVASVYFRVAVHELGHALGLHHELRVPFFMTVTRDVAELGTVDTPFPDNIAFAFSRASRQRLQHSPDPEVRPGGPFRQEIPGSDYHIIPPLPRPSRQCA